MITVRRGTLVVYADIGCPWAHLAVHRLHTARSRAGLEDRLLFDVRAFPLELFNLRPTPKPIVDAEIPVVGALDPGAGWQLWKGPEHEYPNTMLLPLEAVQAAKRQSVKASETLDRELRRAFFGQARPISLRHEVLDVASELDDIDVDQLAADLDTGVARPSVVEQKREAARGSVKGSPHVFLADGSDYHNPGIRMRWEGDKENVTGFPVIESDDPTIYERIVRRAIGPERREEENSWTRTPSGDTRKRTHKQSLRVTSGGRRRT